MTSDIQVAGPSNFAARWAYAFFGSCSAGRLTLLVALFALFSVMSFDASALRQVCVPGSVMGSRQTVCWWEGDLSDLNGGRDFREIDAGSGGRGELNEPAETTDALQKDPNEKDPCDQVGNPIIPSTGNKIEKEVDFSSSGEMALGLSRTYNHYWQGAGLFGKHWVSDFDYKLTFGTVALNSCFPRPGGGACNIGSNTIIYAWRPDGRTIKFTKAADGSFYEEKPEAIAKIVPQADGSLWLYGDEGELEMYSATGYVTKVRNLHNISWTFTYVNGTYPSRITHTSGRYIEFTWSSGQLTAVRDPAGNYYGYAYAANMFGTGLHRLASSSQPGTPASTVTYHYEVTSDATALTGKSFNGVRYSKFTYDANGYATSTEHSGLEKYTFAYTPGANGLLTVVETNPLGKKTTRQFQDGKPTSVTGHPSTYCPLSSYALTEYDSNGYPAMRSDFNNNKTAYTYNAKGQLKQKIEAYGTPQARTTLYEWWGPGVSNRLMSETVVGLSRTVYNYDGIQRISRITVTNLSSFGVTNQSRDTWFTYTDYGTTSGGVSSPGMLKSVTVDGPVAGSDDAYTTNYDNQGNLTSSVNSLGHATIYSNHNGLGQPGRVTGANGEITDAVYDARGRVTLQRTYPTTTTSADTTYTYNANGTIASVTTADGVTKRYAYDAGLRAIAQYIGAPDALEYGDEAESQRFTYNAASNITSIRNQLSSGHWETVYTGCYTGGSTEENCHDPIYENRWVDTSVIARSAYVDYDELSRPRASRGNGGQNVRYTYDLNGNIKTITDSLNRVTTLTYDALNRVIQSKDPLNGLTKFEYNAADQLTKVTDPRGKITTYVYDGFGQLWAQTSPDTGTTTFTYNAAGQRTQMTRSDGSITTYTYDTLGRLTKVTAGGQIQVYGYDWCINGKSRLCNADGPSASIHYQYELDGRIRVRRELTTGNGVQTDYWTRYYYDGIGRLNAITYPNGQAVGYGYASGKLKTMTVNIGGVVTNVVTGTLYQPFGPATNWTYGNGLTRSYAYDLDGRATAITAKNGTAVVQSLGYLYSANDQITKITNATNSGATQNYVYDELSRLKQFDVPTNTQVFSFDTNGNRTQHVITGAVNRTDIYTIDPNNNRLTGVSGGQSLSFGYDTRGNTTSGGGNSYTYDGFNRLASVTRAGVTSTYTLNAYGQRAFKAAPSHGSYRYIYAGQNQLLAEHKDNGDVWTNYLWFGGELVGMVRGTQTYFIHNDHLGRPEIATNTAKTKVWQVNNYAFSRSLYLDTIGGLNIGFPGQYYDQESGLWYNGFRDYDSNTGRYIQSDPIGLGGGLNTYAYVSGNPVNLIDPLGMAGKPPVNLGGGYSGRVDTFNYGGSASFEIHVYDPRGNEVGVYGPDGWINKHGFKDPPSGLPDDVENECKSVADDFSRRTGLSADRAAKRASKMKSLLRGWFFMGPLIENTTPSPARVCDANPDYPGCEDM